MGRNGLVKGVILVGLGASIYGMLATIVKIAYQEGFTTAEVTVAQFILGWIGLLILNLIQIKNSKKSLPKPKTVDIWKLMLAGTSLGFTSLFYYLSVQFIDVSIAIVLLMQSVWIGIVVESVMSQKFPSGRKIIATIIILGGTLLATNLIQSEIELDWRGILFGMLAACSFSTTMFTSNKLGNYLPVLRKSFLMLSGGAIVILIFALLTQIGPSFSKDLMRFYNESGFTFYQTKSFDFSIFWKYGLFLSLFGTVLPPILFNLGFPRTGLGLGSIISSLELPVSVLMAFILLNEQVLAIQWLGIAIILFAIVLMNLGKKRKL